MKTFHVLYHRKRWTVSECRDGTGLQKIMKRCNSLQAVGVLNDVVETYGGVDRAEQQERHFLFCKTELRAGLWLP